MSTGFHPLVDVFHTAISTQVEAFGNLIAFHTSAMNVFVNAPTPPPFLNKGLHQIFQARKQNASLRLAYCYPWVGYHMLYLP